MVVVVVVVFVVRINIVFEIILTNVGFGGRSSAKEKNALKIYEVNLVCVDAA